MLVLKKNTVLRLSFHVLTRGAGVAMCGCGAGMGMSNFDNTFATDMHL